MNEKTFNYYTSNYNSIPRTQFSFGNDRVGHLDLYQQACSPTPEQTRNPSSDQTLNQAYRCSIQ